MQIHEGEPLKQFSFMRLFPSVRLAFRPVRAGTFTENYLFASRLNNGPSIMPSTTAFPSVIT